MRTLIYARYSSQLQNARSIEDQVAACRERIAREGWTEIGVETDHAISGAAGTGEDQRPGLNALMQRLEAGGVDQILVDTTSRIARNQGDGHHIRDLINFFGARLFTLADGEVDAFKGAIKGLLDEQQRRELAHNIRRGQRGTVREGRVPAGLAYGYRVANRLDGKGGLVRGLREIVPDEAEIVRRIFAEYVAGVSPMAIAARLNADRIPGPRGRPWRASTIRGDRQRRDGMLQNRIYVGEIVHNRTRKVTDPRTRRTLIKPNPQADWIAEPAPDLAIVDRALFDRAQAHRHARELLARPEQARRPRHLLSGLVECGVCGGNYISRGAGKWGCGRYIDGRACTNERTIETHMLEARVLAGLQEKILSAEAVSLFVREYTAEASRVRAAMARDRNRLGKAAQEADRRIANLVAAIEQGLDMSQIGDALKKAQAERSAAIAQLAEIDAEESVVTLHPRLADTYREMIADLVGALQDPEARLEALPQLRALIDRVVLKPKRSGRGCDVVLDARLISLLELAGGRRPDEQCVVTMERVKRLARSPTFRRAKV